MTDFESLGAGAFAGVASAVAFVAAMTIGILLAGDPIDAAAVRAIGIALGVAIGTFLVRRRDIA